jgi:hypothetical protein
MIAKMTIFILFCLVQGSATNARYQGICSWMLDPLACDPESRCHFLQVSLGGFLVFGFVKCLEKFFLQV